MILKKELLTVFYKAMSEARTDIEKNHISLADARIRDALATKVLFGLLHDYEEARIKIYKEFCIKDPSGEPKMHENGGYQFLPRDGQKVQDEVKTLNEETVEIPIDNPKKIKLFLENTKYEPAVGEAIMIDDIIVLIGE